MMDEVDNKEADEISDFGTMLSEERIAQNYSIRDINENIKIPIEVLSAIEACDMAALPAITFTRGYIRSYAKFLEISEDRVLKLYYKALPDKKASGIRPQAETVSKATSRMAPKLKMTTVYAIFAAVIVLVYVSFQYFQEKTDIAEDGLTSETDSVADISPDTTKSQHRKIEQNSRLTEDGELIVDQKPDQAQSTNEETADVNSGHVNPAEIESKTEAVDNGAVSDVEKDALESTPENETSLSLDEESQTAVPVVSSVERPVEQTVVQVEQNADGQYEDRPESRPSATSDNEDSISFYTQDASWLEVWDANEVRLFYNMLPEGGQTTLKGRAPFSVKLGNANTTKVEINNTEINFSNRIRSSNTVNFKVSNEGQEVIFH